MNHPIKTVASVIGIALIAGHALADTSTLNSPGAPGGANRLALGISSQVAGSSSLADHNPSSRAFLSGIDSIGMARIGILGGTDSHANGTSNNNNASNNNGPLVGFSYRW